MSFTTIFVNDMDVHSVDINQTQQTSVLVKTSWRLLQGNIFLSSKTSWRRLEEAVLQKRLEDVLKEHTSQVTTASSTKASVITSLQVGHFTVVSNDFILTGQIFADFITSTNCVSKIASLSSTTVELVVVLKYLSFWLKCILKLVSMYNFPSATSSINCE